MNFSAVTYSLVNGIDTLNDNLAYFKSVERTSFGSLAATFTMATAVVNAATYLLIISTISSPGMFSKPIVAMLTVYSDTLKYSVVSDEDAKLTSITLNVDKTLTIVTATSMRPVMQLCRVV